MTQSNRGDPLLRYFGENDEYVSPQEYRLRVGKAINVLREELPQFFQRGVCSTSIYAPNIRVIEASHTNVTLQGKPIYFLLAGTIRWSFRMWFRDLEFEIQSIRVNDRGSRGLGGMDLGGDRNNMTAVSNVAHMSSKNRPPGDGVGYMGRTHHGSPLDFYSRYNGYLNDPFNVDAVDRLDGAIRSSAGSTGDGQEDKPATTVTVRWTMKGTTRPSVVLTSSGPTLPPPSSYAGIFVYQFNERGLIDEHRIENIMPSPSPEAIQRAFAWWGWLLSRTRPAAAAASDDVETRKRLGLGCMVNK